MSIRMKLLAMVLLSVSAASVASSPEDRVQDNLLSRCEKDVNRYCADSGDTTLKHLMCLLARQDDLSPPCKEDMLEVASTAIAGPEALDYSISACETDVDAYCRNVQPGEGRVVGCIKANESKVSKACISALKETGLWEYAK